ncbi:MAG: MBOAT family protein [Gammaproteobacteria bacterium]|nr:MBOAT family protein [Gammaproteobacteria bacterium]MBQ0838873.1 MBOAT family protein [Gammaproteobacteria bacterium]
MLFSSYPFIFAFLPITLIGYFFLSRQWGKEPAIAWLVVCSLTFYSWWNPHYLALLSASIIINYLMGKALAKSPRKKLLVFGVALNLLALGYYKYANFFVDNVNSLFDSHIYLQEIILPLAISFFTFQQIAFLVDAYRGEAEEYSFLHYCLFVTFFPQLIAGPIVHHKEMLPQFSDQDSFSFKHSDFAIGSTIFTFGLFKKVVIADQLAPFANVVFNTAANGELLSSADAWAGTIAYSLQLYFDFSGYSDMAIGLALLFGIRLPLNFHSPYKALNIIDFWRRWHMTLSRFLRDYLYIALGGNRKGSVRRYINLSATMLLGGIWHGAGWQFFIWGAMHGIFLVINHFWHHIKPQSFEQQESFLLAFSGRFLSRLLTLFCVLVAWVFFRASDTATALDMLQAMFSLSEAGFVLTDKGDWLNIVAVGSVIALFLPNTQQLMARYKPVLLNSGFTLSQTERFWKWQPNIFWAGAITALFIWSMSRMTGVSEFLYFQF